MCNIGAKKRRKQENPHIATKTEAAQSKENRKTAILRQRAVVRAFTTEQVSRA